MPAAQHRLVVWALYARVQGRPGRVDPAWPPRGGDGAHGPDTATSLASPPHCPSRAPTGGPPPRPRRHGLQVLRSHSTPRAARPRTCMWSTSCTTYGEGSVLRCQRTASSSSGRSARSSESQDSFTACVCVIGGAQVGEGLGPKQSAGCEARTPACPGAHMPTQGAHPTDAGRHAGAPSNTPIPHKPHHTGGDDTTHA
jgi:hypothetical protein